MLTFRHGATYCDVIKNIMVSFRLLDIHRIWFMQFNVLRYPMDKYYISLKLCIIITYNLAVLYEW